MASARERLSANMAALSYGFEQAAANERALDISVGTGRQPGPLERRRQSTERAGPESMSLELERGKPFKNLGRMIASEMGIALPYNFDQAAEAAEQAQIDYDNENDAMATAAATFSEQMLENQEHAANSVERRLYAHQQQLGMDAAKAFFVEGASPEQRNAARAEFLKLAGEARTWLAGDANERTRVAMGFVRDELAASRSSLINLDLAEKDRVFSTEAELARLDNVAPGSTEEQLVLREILGNSSARAQSTMSTTLGALGGAAGVMSANPYVAGAGALASAAGQILGNMETKLDRDTVVKMVLEQNDALDAMVGQFRPELVRLQEGVAADAKAYGIPSTSWSATPIELERRYTDAWRARLFSGGSSSTPDAAAPVEEAPPPTAEAARANAALAIVPERFRRPTR